MGSIGFSESKMRAKMSVRTLLYRWHLADVQRAKALRKPQSFPQPVWFTLF